MADSKTPSTNADQLITEHLDIWTTAIEQKSSSGRGSSKKFSLHGIKKLRELILELAVRGKLVPQDPKDSSPQQALRGSIDKKEALINDGVIKRSRSKKNIKDEHFYSYPSSWSTARLEELLNVINGRAYKKAEMLTSGTPILRVGNLFTSNDWYYSDLQLEPEKYIDDGDLIYAWSASFGPFIWNGGKVIYHYHIWKMDIYSEIALDKNFSKLFLAAISERIKASGNGIAMIHMTKERMEKVIHPLPPIEEQQRIVAKVDELMNLCDVLEAQTENSIAAHQTLVEVLLEALLKAPEQGATPEQATTQFQQNWQRLSEHFDTLFTTTASIDTLKQTILQLAVMGKLVPQNPNDEPAAKLLERIAAEKAQLIKDKKIKKQKPLPEITDEEKPFELPKGWEWVNLGELVTIRGGKRLPKGQVLSRQVTPYIYIRVSDMRNGSIREDDLHYITEDVQSQISNYIITTDDLYMTIVGATIGKCGLIPIRFNGMNLTENAARLTPFIGVDKYYLFKYLDSDFAQEQFFDKTKQVGVQKMALNRLSTTKVPLPSVEEQRRIVTKVDELMALCDQLKASLTDAQTTKLHLTDAIVEQAL
ncbi:restriction endonuclease subunit S [Pseudoalteromonas sp. CR1]|uniref:restriction endonuclease subunit S n=1 Tax=Pseudoalteromonas sp. CR1 TaxID=2861964 RepID=UPI001C5F050C|nr:restriction endonuclease subunit S [Pseudoalteromonas sp. CR1]MBW4965094.1 restriction endonuclease subunit S [Pseudoalteromonas sp. CR1]